MLIVRDLGWLLILFGAVLILGPALVDWAIERWGQ